MYERLNLSSPALYWQSPPSVISGCPKTYSWASQVALVVKTLPANAGDIRDVGSTPESERFPGGGHGNPLQYSCLKNLMDRGAWQVTVCRVLESDMTEVTEHLLRHTLTCLSALAPGCMPTDPEATLKSVSYQ